ncbi:hypothetical protein Y032_0180g797 [Ancylostoma ceylanicum]|uniref:Uncharacterized protein n=1 Tax=Ancylostoma ceylanicum TaxID=53326 RepID=A0A016SSG3_9BILA|nr:hypothetical protein Y032_0180g797 [Ancylostoma ceylanicum]
MDTESVISNPNNPICKISPEKYPFTPVCQRWNNSYQSCQGRHTYVGMASLDTYSQNPSKFRREGLFQALITNVNTTLSGTTIWMPKWTIYFGSPQCFYRNPTKMGLRFKVGTMLVFSTSDNPIMESFSVKKFLKIWAM